jgi:hypothetical protein
MPVITERIAANEVNAFAFMKTNDNLFSEIMKEYDCISPFFHI